MKKLIAIIFLAALLSGCPGLPLHWNVNILEKIEAKHRKGSFQIVLPFEGSEFNLLGFVGSNKSGEYKIYMPATLVMVPLPEIAPIPIPIDFSSQEMSVKLTSAVLKYDLVLKTIGDLEGIVKVQAYLTNSEGDLLLPGSRLGELISFDLSTSHKSFSREIELTSTQLDAINEKKLKIGFKVSGSVKVLTAGVSGISYELKALSIKDMRFAFEQLLPDKNGEIADFSDHEPIPTQVVGLNLDYIIGLKHDGDFNGTIDAQVYLAPIGENDIFQEKYEFGESSEVILSKNEQDISGRASINSLQLEAARKDQKLRFGILVKGNDVGINKGGTIVFEYKLKKVMMGTDIVLF